MRLLLVIIEWKPDITFPSSWKSTPLTAPSLSKLNSFISLFHFQLFSDLSIQTIFVWFLLRYIILWTSLVYTFQTVENHEALQLAITTATLWSNYFIRILVLTCQASLRLSTNTPKKTVVLWKHNFLFVCLVVSYESCDLKTTLNPNHIHFVTYQIWMYTWMLDEKFVLAGCFCWVIYQV